jgi:hypothetical protein
MCDSLKELVASSLWREGRAGLEEIARANIIPPIGDAALLAASNLEINVWAVRRQTHAMTLITSISPASSTTASKGSKEGDWKQYYVNHVYYNPE